MAVPRHGRRAELLARASAAFGERARDLGALVTREMGKPLAEGIGEAKSLAHGVAEHLDEIGEALVASEVDLISGRTTPISVLAP